MHRSHVVYDRYCRRRNDQGLKKRLAGRTIIKNFGYSWTRFGGITLFLDSKDIHPKQLELDQNFAWVHLENFAWPWAKAYEPNLKTQENFEWYHQGTRLMASILLDKDYEGVVWIFKSKGGSVIKPQRWQMERMVSCCQSFASNAGKLLENGRNNGIIKIGNYHKSKNYEKNNICILLLFFRIRNVRLQQRKLSRLPMR